MLKWGDPSFVNKYGSTLRMDWKEKKPNQYALYFQYSSKLVDTFRMVFDYTFQLDDRIPIPELKECCIAALNYHNVKQLITLGI